MEKVLLFDIDETLIYNNNYPYNMSSIKEKIESLKEDYDVGICTSRSYDLDAKRIIDEYNINGLIICEAGACVFLNDKLIYKYTDEVLNDKINKLLYEYKDIICLNKNRINSSTLSIKEEYKMCLNKIIKILKAEKYLDIARLNKLKIGITYKNINKIKTIDEMFNNKQVIFITDYEKNIPKHKDNIKIYSIGNNNLFNSKCDKIFKNIEDTLDELRSDKCGI